MPSSGPIEHSDPIEFLSSILAAVPWFVTRVDLDYRIRYINKVQPPLTFEMVVGSSVFDFLDDAHRVTAEACYEQVLATKKPGNYEVASVGADGEPAEYANYITPILKDDTVIGFCAVSHEISIERARERSLLNKQRELQLAVAATRMGLWSWSVQTNTYVWNERMKEICGVSEPLDLEAIVETLVHPDDREQALEVGRTMLLTDEVVHNTARLVIDGSIRWVISTGQASFDEHGKVTSLTGGLIDITEERRTEEQLFHAQKMEAIGQLTTGVAHNFNNLLMVLLPTLEMLGEEVEGEPKELVDDALAVAKRAADIVRKLMELAGQKSAPVHQAIELSELARDALRICERTFERRLRLSFRHDDSYSVLGNPGELTQVLVNLLINARDALIGAKTPEPRVEVVLEAVVDTAPPESVPEAPAWVALRVIDNGPGISADVREHLFEPFFSTKGAVGTGMGLATSAAILERHNGWLDCTSSGETGTEFCAYLPVPKAEEPEDDATRGPRLLMIDDEAAVRRAFGRFCDRDGIPATLVASAGETRELLDQRTDFDVVLLDRSMPDDSDSRLLAELRGRLPQAKILYFTGENVSASELAAVDGIVVKPVSIAALLEAVQRVLDA